MNKLAPLSIPLTALLLGAAGITAFSQAKKAPAESAPQKTDAKKPVPWNIQFDQMESNEATGETEFTKAVAVSDEGTTIKSDTWRLNQKKKTAIATGSLQMTDPQADATGKRADIDYAKGKRLLVLTGDVEILVKPKKDAATPPPGPAEITLQDGKATVKDPNASEDDSVNSARKHPATITCDKLEYEYARDKKHATLTGNFKVVQKLKDRTRTLTAEHAEWFGLEDRILLHPPVHIEETRGLQSFDTNEPVTVYVKEGDERMSAKKGSGVYQVEEDEENPASKPADKPAAQPAKEPGKPAQPGKTP